MQMFDRSVNEGSFGGKESAAQSSTKLQPFEYQLLSFGTDGVVMQIESCAGHSSMMSS
jgi:hypothetical protein